MPVMVPLSGKARKIKEQILGSPRNEHKAHSQDPRIRETDRQRVIAALLTNIINQGQMPQGNQGMQ
jgi:hypothetical protein